jgi:hypothetical protein
MPISKFTLDKKQNRVYNSIITFKEFSMTNFHIIWVDQTGREQTTHITADTFEDACRHIGCDPSTSREDTFGVSWETSEIVFPIPERG